MGDEFNKFGEWEEAWQQAFEGSEHTPPNRVWQGLENSLMEQQLRRYKRKVFLYQWLAAASVLLLSLWAGWWFFAQPSAADRPVIATEVQPAAAPENTAPKGRATEQQAGALLDIPLSATNNAAEQDAQAETEPFNAPTNSQSVTNKRALAEQLNRPKNISRDGNETPGTAKTTTLNKDAASPMADLDNEQHSLAEPASSGAVLSTQASGIGSVSESPAASVQQEQKTAEGLLSADAFNPEAYNPEIAGLKASLALADGNIRRDLHVVPVRRKAGRKRSSSPNGDFWLGASLASNYFDPNMGTDGGHSLGWTQEPVSAKGGQKVYSTNAGAWDQENSLPSINFSVDAAFRIGQRWIFQSSLEYGTYKVSNVSGTFTDANTNQVYPLYYSNFSYDKLQVVSQNSRKASPINTVSAYNFVSIPLVFNYVLFEKRVGLSLGTGLSTDVFLGGSITDQEKNLEAYNIGTGPQSPFNRLHFNALMGAQLFYRAGANHLFTLEPSYKYSITNFNKRISYFDSRPRQIGVAVGFRYIIH